MQAKCVFVFCLLFAVAMPIGSQAQQQSAAPPAAEAPLLTLDEAISLALQNNRLVKNSSLEAQKFDFKVSTARSQRLPHTQFAVLGGELLHSFDFTIPKGSLGTYPATGPLPGTDAKVRTPAQFTTYTTAGIDQPLTQQYKIHLAIRATELGRDVAREDVRAERQKITNQVRKAYFELVAIQVGVEATRRAVATLEEAQRVTTKHELERAVLRSDALDVETRLARSAYDLSVAENGLATEREHLNQLLGRALSTAFSVTTMPEVDSADLSLESARQDAQRNRPEIRQTQLKQKQSEYDRRLAKAEYIPDLSLAVRYQGISNVEMLPANVSSAGFLLTWEPFDWGRRHNAVAEKSKAVEQARNLLQETESQIAVEVGMKFRKWKETALLLKAARIGDEAAAEKFRVTSNKYKEQAALIKDLLQAQSNSSEADFQYQQALSAYWSALADLRRATGEE